MKIAFYGFRGGRGGIGHVMINLMNGLIDMGIPVDILLNNPEIPELKLLAPDVRLVQLGNLGGIRRVKPMVKYLQTERPAVILANREPAVRAITLAKPLSGCQTFVAVRVGMAVSIALKRRGLIKRWLRHASIRYCYRRADAIIANDPAVAEDVAGVTGISLSAIHVLANPTVSRDLFRQAAEPVDHPWFAEEEPPVVIGVGRLARQKDFPTLLRAVAILRKKIDCRLMLLGEGKEHSALEKLAVDLGISDITDFPGHAANPFAFMARSSLFVLSSAWEGSPNVLIQALALGVPVVSTDCRSGPAEILQNGRHGPLVPVGDPEALAGAMEKTLNLPPAPDMLRLAAERYRSDVCCRRYVEVLKLVETADATG